MCNKNFINNIKLILSLIFGMLYVNPSHAYVLDLTFQHDRTYTLRGHLDSSELISDNRRAMDGMLIIYYDTTNPNTQTPSYWNKAANCTKDRDESLRIINENLNNVLLTPLNWHNFPDTLHIMKISCYVSLNLSWRFSANIGKPLDQNAGSCKITAPLDVNFGTVMEGDNNEVIEKQVSIKCDKATKMKLTLQGDSDKNILVISGTTIKLGVGGDSQSKIYDMKANEKTMANLIFTLSDTGATPGAKKGYVLLLSEVP